MNNFSRPFLSICIPTYNGAHFLKVTLEALLPQVAEVEKLVEVLVVDDVSPDNTPEVAEAARKYGPFRYIRNQTNLGIIKNEINAAIKHATGEYIWAWNQHCLIYPGALAKLLGILRAYGHLDAFYINFRCAQYPGDWPSSAVGGYDGQFDYIGIPDLESHDVARWEDLLDASKNRDGTQSYAHIARRSKWKRYWEKRTVNGVFRSAETTYPHACTVAEGMFGKPSYYIGDPLITIFNGAQTWGAVEMRSRVCLFGLPDLTRFYANKGLSSNQLKSAKASNKAQLYRLALAFFKDPPEKRHLFFVRIMFRLVRSPYLIWSFWRGFIDSESSLFARGIKKINRMLVEFYQYSFYRCRPARWFWSKYRS
jgi:glycosyltransferase involved in cell wall biosynthesis